MKKVLVIGILLAGVTSLHSEEGPWQVPGHAEIGRGTGLSFKCQDNFEQVPLLAKRLNVKPLTANRLGTDFIIPMCDGTAYSLFDLINAALDKLDKK